MAVLDGYGRSVPSGDSVSKLTSTPGSGAQADIKMLMITNRLAATSLNFNMPALYQR